MKNRLLLNAVMHVHQTHTISLSSMSALVVRMCVLLCLCVCVSVVGEASCGGGHAG